MKYFYNHELKICNLHNIFWVNELKIDEVVGTSRKLEGDGKFAQNQKCS